MKTIAYIITSILLILNGNSVFAQNEVDKPLPTSEEDLAINTIAYKSAVGLRAGGTSGITYKRFLNSENSVLLLAGFWSNGVSLTAIYEWNRNAFDVPGLNWYYGGGIHGSIWSKPGYYYSDSRKYENEDGFGLGVDGLVGMEYKVKAIPFAFSFDFKPFVEFRSDGRIGTSLDPGLGVKLTF